MRWFLLVLGIVVLFASVMDVFASVVRPDSSGVLAVRIARWVWGIGRRVHERRPSHGMLAFTGVAAVVALPLTWLMLMWTGWSLVFHGSPRAVLDADSGAPADGWSRIYFAGYSLFTSGLGDKVPGGAPWQVATALATAMGLGLITLAMTFLIPVVQAANTRRAVARQISDLGHTPDGILERHGDHDFLTLAALTESMPAVLGNLASQHRSYPVLSHLHSTHPSTAFMPRLAALHDAALVGTTSEDPTIAARLTAVTAAVAAIVDAIEPDDRHEAPPLPRGVPQRQEIRLAFERTASIRRRLWALIDADGWDWSTVEAQPAEPERTPERSPATKPSSEAE